MPELDIDEWVIPRIEPPDRGDVMPGAIRNRRCRRSPGPTRHGEDFLPSLAFAAVLPYLAKTDNKLDEPLHTAPANEVKSRLKQDRNAWLARSLRSLLTGRVRSKAVCTE